MAFNEETGKYEGYIYKIYNDVNDKIYIGQTRRDVRARWNQHKNEAKKEIRPRSVIHDAMHKYGIEHFSIRELAKVEEDSVKDLKGALNVLECMYIEEYQSLCEQNGYNIEKGGSYATVNEKKVNQYDFELNYIRSFRSTVEAADYFGIDKSYIGRCCRHENASAAGYIWSYDGEDPLSFSQFYEKINKQRKEKKDKEDAVRLEGYGFPIEEIYQYDGYGRVVNIFENIIDAANKLGTHAGHIIKNLTGENTAFHDTFLRLKSDPFDKYPFPTGKKPVDVYDESFQFVESYINVYKACDALNISKSRILSAIKNGNSTGGYYFSFYKDDSHIYVRPKRMKKVTPIEMCDEHWNVVETFYSFVEAANYFGYHDCHHKFNEAITNKTPYQSFYWRVGDEIEIDVNIA